MTETPLPYRRLSKGDSQKSSDVAPVRHWQADAANPACTCLNDEVCLALGEAGGDEKRKEEDWGEEEKYGGLHDGDKDGLYGWSCGRDFFSNQRGLCLLSFTSDLQTERENVITVKENDGEQIE